MKEFQTSKNGYNKKEVDLYVEDTEQKLNDLNEEINVLKNQLNIYTSQEKEIRQKEDNISIALTAAVEKAKQIEKSSKKVYELKIQELEILYKRWEKVLNEIVNKYPDLDEVDNVKELLNNFKTSINNSVKQDFKFMQTNKPSASDPMKELLEKMNGNIEKQIQNKTKPQTKTQKRKTLQVDMQTKQSELKRLEEKAPMIKPIYNAHVEKGENYNSLLDKFLTEDATDNAYSVKLTNKEQQSVGFDLKEAVNPTDDLETIMKSFDFFN